MKLGVAGWKQRGGSGSRNHVQLSGGALCWRQLPCGCWETPQVQNTTVWICGTEALPPAERRLCSAAFPHNLPYSETSGLLIFPPPQKTPELLSAALPKFSNMHSKTHHSCPITWRNKDLLPLWQGDTETTRGKGWERCPSAAANQVNISLSVPVTVPKIMKRKALNKRKSNWSACMQIYKGKTKLDDDLKKYALN